MEPKTTARTAQAGGTIGERAPFVVRGPRRSDGGRRPAGRERARASERAVQTIIYHACVFFIRECVYQISFNYLLCVRVRAFRVCAYVLMPPHVRTTFLCVLVGGCICVHGATAHRATALHFRRAGARALARAVKWPRMGARVCERVLFVWQNNSLVRTLNCVRACVLAPRAQAHRHIYNAERFARLAAAAVADVEWRKKNEHAAAARVRAVFR